MPQPIFRERVLQLQQAGTPIIDVLPPQEHEEMRIAGAVNVWLRQLDESAVAGMSRTDPVVVYCHDFL